MNMKKCVITAVVVTYNRKNILGECLEALERQKAKPVTVARLLETDQELLTQVSETPGGFHFHVLVVDNASTDGTQEYIQPIMERHPGKISYLRLEENQGGAGGFSYGIKQAVEQGADYVWIMDDDTVPEPDTMEQLLQGVIAVQRSGQQFGFLSSEVLWTDETPCKMNRQMEVEPTDAAQQDLKENAHLIPVKSATFVSLLISAEAVRTYGLPIKEYFIWGDDKEFTLRLSDNLPCYKVADSVVHHLTKNNEGSNITKDDLERIHRYYYAYRNDLATAKKRGGKEVLTYRLAYILNTLRILLFSKEGKGKRLAVMRQGKKDGEHFAPEIEFPER
jgi:GT2 family glycosyltransferase